MHIGQYDQMKSAINDMAQYLRDYYTKMIEVGFTGEQAFFMTVELQKSLFKQQ